MIRYCLEDNDVEPLARAAHALDITRESRILNIACEFKRVPPFLEGTVDPEQVFGVEIDRGIVAEDSRILYCDVDEDAFPFDDESFDLTVSIFGVEHFRSANVFREAHRTLKPGGTFLFLVPNGLYPAFLLNRLLGERFAEFYYRRVMRSAYTPHAAYYRFNRLGSIRRAAEQAGFSEMKLTFYGPSNILLYTRRLPAAQRLVRLFERMLTNGLLFRFKPYILAELVRGPHPAAKRARDDDFDRRQADHPDSRRLTGSRSPTAAVSAS